MSNATDATLSGASGPVFVERQGSLTVLNEGDGIFESDTIITGPNTTADITFRDGTKSRLSPDTELKLIEFDFGTGEEPSFVMGLAQGALRTVSGEMVKLNPEAFELVTPRATVGIRGTEFFNSVDGIDEIHAVLYITDGNTMLVTRPNGESITLSKPLHLIDITGENPGKLNLHEFSPLEMEEVINSIAPTLGNNFPKSESEQGNWEKLSSADGNSSSEMSAYYFDETLIINDNVDSNTIVTGANTLAAESTIEFGHDSITIVDNAYGINANASELIFGNDSADTNSSGVTILIDGANNTSLLEIDVVGEIDTFIFEDLCNGVSAGDAYASISDQLSNFDGLYS